LFVRSLVCEIDHHHFHPSTQPREKKKHIRESGFSGREERKKEEKRETGEKQKREREETP
jgi:hypothetical protein